MHFYNQLKIIYSEIFIFIQLENYKDICFLERISVHYS